MLISHTALLNRGAATNHWLKNEELERPDTAPEDSASYRSTTQLFDRRYPFLVAGFSSQSNRFPAKEDRVVRLRHEERDQAELRALVLVVCR